MKFFYFFYFLSIISSLICYEFDWPKSDVASAIRVNESIIVRANQVYDGKNKTFIATTALGTGDQDEGQHPLFKIQNGGTLRNIIIDVNGADGVHCLGSCNVENVYFLKVGEDAITIRRVDQFPNPVVNIIGGGAREAQDKVVQHSAGGTVNIRNYQAENFAKLYRSCGTCSYIQRKVNLENVRVANPKTIVFINTQYKRKPGHEFPAEADIATFKNITVYNGDEQRVCVKGEGDFSGDPKAIGFGSDGKNCVYTPADIKFINNKKKSFRFKSK